MSCPHQDNRSPGDPRQRRMMPRWWLAGLLVSCLLPASLAQAESPRATERLVQICIMAPALIRARTVLKACRRRLASYPPVDWRYPARNVRRHMAPLVAPVAALDVVSPRGPPITA